MSKKVLMLYAGEESHVTGGQKYEDMVAEIWRDVPGVEVERRWVNTVKGRWRRHTARFRTLRLFGELRRYDLVVFNSAHGLFFTPLAWALRLSGVPTAVFHHHYIFLGAKGIKRAFYKYWETNFLRAVPTILIPSPYINDICSRQFPRKKLLYWQIPFDSPATPIESKPVPGNLLYIGTIERRKGLMYLMEALKQLKDKQVDCRLTIIGKTVEEDYRRQIDDYIARNELPVRFTGYISSEEMDGIIAATDIFTFPSTLEGYGMVICESMVNGLPVVCFNNSAMPYTVKDGENGFLVDNLNPAAMAAAIEKIVADRSLRGRLSAGARATATTLMDTPRFRTMVVDGLRRLLGGK